MTSQENMAVQVRVLPVNKRIFAGQHWIHWVSEWMSIRNGLATTPDICMFQLSDMLLRNAGKHFSLIWTQVHCCLWKKCTQLWVQSPKITIENFTFECVIYAHIHVYYNTSNKKMKKNFVHVYAPTCMYAQGLYGTFYSGSLCQWLFKLSLDWHKLSSWQHICELAFANTGSGGGGVLLTH